MVKALTCALIVSVHLIANVRTNEGNTTESCAQLYEKAVEAYLENRFEDSALYFEKGLTQYRDYRKKLSYCRLKCKAEADMSEPLYHVNVENLLFFENTVRQTLCIMTCERENPVILENVYMSDDVLKLYEDLKPYEYLHLCYYQVKIFFIYLFIYFQRLFVIRLIKIRSKEINYGWHIQIEVANAH